MKLLLVIYLSSIASALKPCSELAPQSIMFPKPAEWNGFLIAFSLLDPQGELLNIFDDFEHFIRCNSVKIIYFENEEKLMIYPSVDKNCHDSDTKYCINIFNNDDGNSTVKWRVTNYSHLNYLAIKYSYLHKNNPVFGIIIFVDSVTKWMDDRYRFSRV